MKTKQPPSVGRVKKDFKNKKEKRLLEDRLDAPKKKGGVLIGGEVKAPEKVADDQVEEPSEGRKYTVSIAVPGGILDNAQSAELRTYVAGQIARAATVFCVDEIVVYDESAQLVSGSSSGTSSGNYTNANHLMVKLLRYVECPQYLRKQLFPLHSDFRWAGLLNPLDAPHHLRQDDFSVPYREVVTLPKKTREGQGSYVNAGLSKDVLVDRLIEPGLRATVKLLTFDVSQKHLKAKVISPDAPREEDGMYWGYRVRLANSLGEVFSRCPFPDGYDVTVGTSEHGEFVDEASVPKEFRHMIIVFGGLRGLESALEADETIKSDDPSTLFNCYLNVCPNQGSRTIRTEEAILITLSLLKSNAGF